LEALAGGKGRQAIEQAFAQIAAHETEIGERLLSWLRMRNGVRIFGHRTSEASLRVPTISFTVDGRSPQEIVAKIDDARIGVRHGDFHSRRLAETLGLAPAGVIRASLVHYNTVEEVDRLITVLDRQLR
ncbi:MAG: aminotransferase class V-fold PLP-dependent enzyme, partial [Mesorhizobium sp.]